MKYSTTIISVFLGFFFSVTAPELYAQDITTISVFVTTSNNGNGISQAQANVNAYLGIGGREFRLKLPNTPFRAGTSPEYRFGEHANVENAELNDPSRGFPITFKSVIAFPVYIRMSELADDDWEVDEIEVHIFQGNRELPVSWSALTVDPADHIRLGRRFGYQLFLSPNE
jgi:hypothetical protein